MTNDSKKILWYNLAMMAFAAVWGFGNVVNNYANQGLAVIFSWVVIFSIYFIPYALMVGELGSTFKTSAGGVTSWLKNTMGIKIAFMAGWIYWIVHVPYLAQKPQSALVAAGWSFLGDGSLTNMFSTVTLQLICLVVFLLFMYISSKGVRILKLMGGIAGTAMFVMSILYIVMVFAAPSIMGVEFATKSISFKDIIPNFDFTYLTTLSMLVFAVGGCEKLSPYANNMVNPSKDFAKGMIALAVMVTISAVLGSVAMSMMFDAHNIPADLKLNGQYYAFQKLGEYYGVGGLFLVLYGLANLAAQLAVLAISIDAPIKIFLLDADPKYLPKFLTKVTKNGTPINGYLLCGILVSLLIVIPALGIGNMSDLYSWLLDLNSVVMPLRYCFVFLAYFALKRVINQMRFNSDYIFIKNPLLGKIIAGWCLFFTLFASSFGVFPKQNVVEYSSEWFFQFGLNVSTPIILVGLGILFMVLSSRAYRKNNGADMVTDSQ